MAIICKESIVIKDIKYGFFIHDIKDHTIVLMVHYFYKKDIFEWRQEGEEEGEGGGYEVSFSRGRWFYK